MSKPMKCRNDCWCWSVQTTSCDFRLKTGKSRGCPTTACIHYKKRIKYDKRNRDHIIINEPTSEVLDRYHRQRDMERMTYSLISSAASISP